MKKYVLNRYHQKKKKFIDLFGGKCVKCESINRLEFDHINWKNKTFNISRLWSLAEKTVLEELKKCQLLCNDCHKEKNKKDIIEIRTGSTEQPHGTYWRYRKHKCRCIACAKANTIYNKEMHRRHKNK